MLRRSTRRQSVNAHQLGEKFRRLFGALTISKLGDGIGLVAYPWLASATTRNPILLSLVVAATHAPWVVLSLPVGVFADRLARHRLMVGANAVRAATATAAGLAVAASASRLPAPNSIADAAESEVPTNVAVYALILVTTLILGSAEVVHDTAAQSYLPRIVDRAKLPTANGRLRTGETIGGLFAGPPIGAALVAISFALPFFADAATFAVAAVLIHSLKSDPKQRAASSGTKTVSSMRSELSEGLLWLRRHRYLRLLLTMVGVMNFAAGLAFPLLVFYLQEVLDGSASTFASVSILTAGGALLGGLGAAKVSSRFGNLVILRAVPVIGAGAFVIAAASNSWIVLGVVMAIYAAVSVLWSVTTVSIRQTIAPDELLGRVNSAYRLVSRGVIPVAALAGGALVAVATPSLGRPDALRLPWGIAAAIHLALFVVTAPVLRAAATSSAQDQDSPQD